jgi:prepilin-type N-terminal cleavage/methylation domain-containing protein
MPENNMNNINTAGNAVFPVKKEKGFSLVEVIIALTILLVSVLGVFAVFTYATVYNSGNSRRSQALSILQQEVELIRSAKFTPTITDNYAPTTPDNGRRDITGGTKAARIVKGIDGASYKVETIVDNDPVLVGVQSEADTPATKLKEITLVVTPQSRVGSWVVAYPTKVVFRRVRAN